MIRAHHRSGPHVLPSSERRRRFLYAAPLILLISGLLSISEAQVIPTVEDGHPFHSDGEAFTVIYTPNFVQSNPDVAITNQNGNFVVVWRSEGSTEDPPGIYMRRFETGPGGWPTPIDEREDVWLDDSYPCDQGIPDLVCENHMPSVASDLDGRIVIVWLRKLDFPNNPGNESYDVLGRVWSNGWIAPPSPYQYVFDVAAKAQWDTAVGDTSYPSVAQSPDGKFVAVWHGTPDSSNETAVFAQRFGRNLATLGDVIEVSTEGESPDDDSFEHTFPAVSCDYSGNFVVAWTCEHCEDMNNDGRGLDIRCRLFDQTGTPLGNEFTVNSDTEDDQKTASVAVGGSGSFVVGWSSDASSEGQVLARKYDASGSPITLEIPLTSGTQETNEPYVALGDPDAHFMATWYQAYNPINGQSNNLMARWFDASGQTWAMPIGIVSFQSNTPSSSPYFSIAGDPEGGYVVVWQGDVPYRIRGKRYLRPVLLSISGYSVVEGTPAVDGPESTAVLSIQASREHPGSAVRVDHATVDGTANFFEDYEQESGTITFGSGSGTEPVIDTTTVVIIPDDKFEPDEEFYVDLSNPTNAVIVRDRGTVTILNDDLPPTVTIGDVTEYEDSNCDPTTTFEFQVTIDPIQDLDATVDFSTSDMDPVSATAGEDYEFTAGTLMIPGGSNQGSITVEVICEEFSEDDETFLVELSNPVNATLPSPPHPPETGIGTILNDDCYSVTPWTLTFPLEGCPHNYPPGSGYDDCILHFVINDPTACTDSWTVSSPDLWMHDFNPSGGSPPYTPPHNQIPIDFVVDPAGADNRNGTISIAGVTIQVDQHGSACAFMISPPESSYPVWGGSGEFDISFLHPPAPNCLWEVTHSPDWVTLTSPTSGNGAAGGATVTYTVDTNSGPFRNGSIIVSGVAPSESDDLAHGVRQKGYFLDDFDDNVLASTWEYDDIGMWEEAGGSLRADASGAGERTQAIATWAYDGCVEGTIATRMRINGYSTGTAKLFGWYENGDNHVALTMDEFANQWTLTQYVGGSEVQTASSTAFAIEPNVAYDAEIEFDGTAFTVLIDDIGIITMSPGPGSTPEGTVGFEIFETDADIDEIKAITVSPSIFFADDFESGTTAAWSATVP